MGMYGECYTQIKRASISEGSFVTGSGARIPFDRLRVNSQLASHAELTGHSFNKRALPGGEGSFVTGSGARIRT
jgi:hypothetical protein